MPETQNPENLIERKQYMQTLRNLKDRNIIKVITGVRRCGKSTLLQMFADELLQKGVGQEQIQFLNFEDLDTLAIGDIYQIHTHIKDRLVSDKMNYIFLDEAQNIKDFQRLVDSLFIKKNCDVYITGSNAYLLSGELATLLTGRYITAEMLPFSFSEYLQMKKSVNLSEIEGSANVDTQENSAKFLKLLKKESFGNLGGQGILTPVMLKGSQLFDYLFYGGFPYSVKLGENKQSKAFLKSVLNAIVEKDIFQRHEIYAKPAFQKLINFLMDSIGSIVSPNSISKTLKGENTTIDNKTVSQYLDYLSDSFLFYKVSRYDVKGKKLLQTLDKYYLSDTGFRQARLAKGKRHDIGYLLENAVYLELRRRYSEVFIGKWNDYEVDFAAVDSEGYTAYFQVAFSTENPETLERELRPLQAIRNSNLKYLLTTDMDFNPVYDGIRKLNVVDWLLQDNV
ncbi:MAG: ATP-binding protein [Planctomycetaceae bacterium]|jgi:predicted AAA+ superfamily ATPase|nr:ATP-binding protein [Planctomycetaceae bacterium]